MHTFPGAANASSVRFCFWRAVAHALTLVLLLVSAARCEERGAPPFTLDTLTEIAESLAAAPFEDPGASVPKPITAIDRALWEGIAFRPEAALWKDGDTDFSIALHHPGYIHPYAVRINVIENGGVRPVDFSPEMFAYPNPELRDSLTGTAPGFAGFAIRFPYDREKGPDWFREADEVVSFLGASFFQSRGRQSRYGAYARGLAVDTAQPEGEELPRFREFWLERPAPGATAMTIYALLDSPRLTGAYRLDIAPGTAVVMDVEARIFRRRGAGEPVKIGFAPMTSMFLHSETANGAPGDYRPEVHNSDGLLAIEDNGSWTWRPLANPGRLRVSRFDLTNPRGFGLMQRDDDFGHYQDLVARFDRRPSLWVEPKGDWGGGSIELVEIPGGEDFHNNIICYWLPARKPDAVAPQAEPAVFAYRLHWLTPGVTPHGLGRVAATRMRKLPESDVVQYLIDFEGEELNGLQADTGIACVEELPEQFTVVERRLLKNEATSGWRLILNIRQPARNGLLDSIFPSRADGGGARLKALLKQGENLPDPLTETWTFDVPQGE